MSRCASRAPTLRVGAIVISLFIVYLLLLSTSKGSTLKSFVFSKLQQLHPPPQCKRSLTANTAPGFKRRLPQAILIGVMKGGTGAIKQFLSSNPNIKVLRGEPNFFSRNDNYNRGLSYYRSLMPESQPDQITLEGSPAYFVSSIAAQRIHGKMPCARILVTLVNPVDRLISEYTHRMKHKNPTVYDLKHKNRTFEEFFFGGHRVFGGRSLVTNGNYDKRLVPYFTYFPPEQIHVVDGERLKRAPWEELTKIEQFLGLPIYSKKDTFFFSKKRGFYCHRSHGCLNKGKGRRHPDVNTEQRQVMEHYYGPHNEQLVKMLNRSFLWIA